MSVPTKFSPVDAARVALASPPISLSPAPARVAVGAAVLWCRSLAFPSVRQLAVSMRRAPVTVLNRFDHLIDVYAEVIRREWMGLERGWHRPVLADRLEWLAEHARTLAAVDPALLRLPMLVRAAVVGADPSLATPDWWAFSAPLHLVASLAEPGVALPPPPALHAVLTASSASLSTRVPGRATLVAS